MFLSENKFETFTEFNSFDFLHVFILNQLGKTWLNTNKHSKVLNSFAKKQISELSSWLVVLHHFNQHTYNTACGLLNLAEEGRGEV